MLSSLRPELEFTDAQMVVFETREVIHGGAMNVRKSKNIMHRLFTSLMAMLLKENATVVFTRTAVTARDTRGRCEWYRKMKSDAVHLRHHVHHALLRYLREENTQRWTLA